MDDEAYLEQSASPERGDTGQNHQILAMATVTGNTDGKNSQLRASHDVFVEQG